MKKIPKIKYEDFPSLPPELLAVFDVLADSCLDVKKLEDTTVYNLTGKQLKSVMVAAMFAFLEMQKELGNFPCYYETSSGTLPQ